MSSISSTELVQGQTASAPAVSVDRDRARRAARVLAFAAAVGLLVQFLFYESLLGINYPITVAVLVTAGWLARDPAAPRPPIRSAAAAEPLSRLLKAVC